MKNKEKVPKESSRELFVAIIQVLADAWKYHSALLVAFLSIAVFTALIPFLVRGAEALLLNQLTTLSELKQVSPFIFLLLLASAGMFFLQGSLEAFFRYIDKIIWFRFHHRHDIALSEKLASLDVATHEDPKFKDQVQLLQENGEAFAMARVLGSIVFNLKNSIALIVALTIIAAADWRFLPLIIVASLPGFYADIKYGRKIWSIHQSKSQDRRSYQHVKNQSRNVTGIRELQTFQTVPFFIERQRVLLRDFLSAQLGQEKKLLGLQLFSALLTAACILLVLYILVNRVIAHELQIGTFVFILGAILSFQGAIVGFFSGFAQLQKDARPAKTFFDIMARQSYITRPVQGTLLNVDQAPRIEFRNVSFAYPSAPEINVLEDFSLTIESGERMAFVGINGAGKSTLVKLLCRFYDPTSGAIFINGVDLREIDLESWYSNLALLAQDYQTYSFKAWEVIGLGRLSADRKQEEIARAAERAQADSFINKWEQTYSTQIGVEFSGGVDPSGGQKQKLSLARALYRNALVTVLDEPTAHVDAAAEQNIFNRLESEFPRNRTLLMISHRFSTVRNADRICVIEHNRVKELGTHEELIKLDGTYAELFHKQAEAYR